MPPRPNVEFNRRDVERGPLVAVVGVGRLDPLAFLIGEDKPGSCCLRESALPVLGAILLVHFACSFDARSVRSLAERAFSYAGV